MKTTIAIVLLSPSLFFVWLAVRGMWRFYRDHRPNRYLPNPSKEALRKHTTQAVT